MSDAERYVRACHAMQTGVATEMAYNDKPTNPKHLRVGVNSAMVNDAALVRLLMAKGIITEDEHAKAVADEMELEVIRYKMRIEKDTGMKVELI